MTQRRNPRVCRHRNTITTITAGLAREVCEACARVRLRYVEPAVQLYPDAVADPVKPTGTKAFEATVTFSAMSRLIRCQVCEQSAVFAVPDGLMCNEHAWQSAARIDWTTTDPWVPIPTN